MRDKLGSIAVNEEQIELAKVAAAFCRDKSPVATVRDLIAGEQSHDRAVWKEMAALGWLGIAIPEEHGGVGLTLTETVPVVEQMGRALMTGPFITTTLAAQLLLKAGTPAQQSEWLAKLATSTKATLALTETGSNYEPGSGSATATQSGDTITLSGSKIMVTDADTADLIIVSAELNAAPALILIPRDAIPDTALRCETVIDETRQSYEFTLDDLKIPAANLLDQSKTAPALHHLHLAANLLLAAEMCGGAQSCIDYTLEYLKTRKQFGKQIGAFQALKHAIVDVYCEYEKARSHLYSAAWCFDAPGQGPETGEVAVRMAKAQADKAFSFAADRAIQFHGGFGFTYDCDAQLYRRRAMWCAAQHGDADYHKQKLGQLLF